MSPDGMPLKPLKPLPSSLLKHDHTVLAPRISDHSSACTGCRHTKKGGIRCTQTSTKAEVVDINSCGTTAASDAAMKSPCPRCGRRCPRNPRHHLGNPRHKHRKSNVCTGLPISTPAHYFSPVRTYIPRTIAAERSVIVTAVRAERPHNVS